MYMMYKMYKMYILVMKYTMLWMHILYRIDIRFKMYRMYVCRDHPRHRSFPNFYYPVRSE